MAVIECALLTVDPARAAAFEAAVAGCAPLFRAASGCRSLSLEREIEDPARYMLRVGWDSVEDHMVGFRDSAAFGRWREAVGEFFAGPPVVVHRTVVVPGF